MASEALITLLLPFYNEQGFIGATVASLAQQSDRRFRLVLVDNGSSDAGRAEAIAAAAAMSDIETTLIEESTAGKVFALRSGLATVSTPFVGTIDADTIYPRDYVATCLELFERNPSASCVIATAVADRSLIANRLQRLRISIYATLFRNRSHGGGCGQAFRTSNLLAVGGFDPSIWPYVLEDHEIIHRIADQGPIVHSSRHYCTPADRRFDRRNVSWNRVQRITYKLMPRKFMGWYFYRFLAARFYKHGKLNSALRRRNWAQAKKNA